jgi:glycosyltransferase involved in cell wall biosynthesis
MHILMVSTEYPPMLGGIGRYTANLTKELQRLGLDIHIVCDEKGNGDFPTISPNNAYNSDVLLKIVNEIKPDIVHVQFDPGLYGLILDSKDPRKAWTYIDQFYTKCKIPIVTTFHSGYLTLRQWIRIPSLLKNTGRIGTLGTPVRAVLRLWKYYSYYSAINNLIREKIRISRASIVFSQYLAKRLGNNNNNKCHVIYHGSEPADAIAAAANAIHPDILKKKMREKFSIPIREDQKIALAFGFRTDGKGWDIMKKMDIPSGWIIVANSSKSYYNKEALDLRWMSEKGATNNNKIIDLDRGYLSDDELSMLFYASDAVILPYKTASGSGVMFDALAHGLPFVATDLEVFREFSKQGLGITVKRQQQKFSEGLDILTRNYSKYAEAVNKFKQKLKWNSVAEKHYRLYNNIAGDLKMAFAD